MILTENVFRFLGRNEWIGFVRETFYHHTFRCLDVEGFRHLKQPGATCFCHTHTSISPEGAHPKGVRRPDGVSIIFGSASPVREARWLHAPGTAGATQK